MTATSGGTISSGRGYQSSLRLLMSETDTEEAPMHRTKHVVTLLAGIATLLPAMAVAAPGDTVVAVEATFPYLGTTATIEKVEGDDGLEVRAVGADRHPVDVEKLVAADRLSRRERLGALDPTFARYLGKVAADARVPVAIWLVERERALGDRPAAKASVSEIDNVLRARSEQRAAEVAELTGPWLAQLREFDRGARASTTSPLVWATVPVTLVRELAQDEQIDTIYGDLEKGGPETNLSRLVVGADFAPAAGLNGSGVQVGVVESGGLADTANPFHTIERSDAGGSCGSVTAHATGVNGIIGAQAGTRTVTSPFFPWPALSISSTLTGFASASRISVGSWCSTGDNRTRLDSAVGWGARIINNSYFTDTTGAVTANDRHADGLVHNSWRLVVKSAGNRGGGDNRVTSPGLGYNVLAVGNVDLRATSARADDVMAATSSFADPTSTNGDREKPELAAPGTNIQMLSNGFPFGGQTSSGTSFASPMVTGSAARLVQRKPLLGVWPEQLRAILMASAVRNVEGDTRLSDVDGAGMIAVNSAVRILDDNGHGGEHVDCATFGGSKTVATVDLRQEQRLRAAISWTTDPSASDHASRPSADLDLQVRGPGGSVFSSSFDNTSEIVDMRAPQAGSYEIRVINFRCARSTFVGWAHMTA